MRNLRMKPNCFLRAATFVGFTFPSLFFCVVLVLAGCEADKTNSSTRPKEPPLRTSPTLNQLIKEYSKPELLYGAARTAEGIPIMDEAAIQAKEWYHVDYPKLICASARGDDRALEKLLSLRLDGAAAEGHGINLLALLEGLGDQRFAASLRRCSAKVQASVREDLDLTVQGNENKYHAKFPATFSKSAF